MNTFNVLLSYHYYRTVDLDDLFGTWFQDTDTIRLFVDSGGFSAKTQGVEIDLNAYAEWVKRWSHWITVAANLDVIGNAEATETNQKRLEDKGLTVLPVFHAGSDFKHLETYLETYDYIALGGLVPHLRFPKRFMPWLLKCFKLAEGRAQYHGFGVTQWYAIKQFPWKSTDSSSWGASFRYGQIRLFDRGKWVEARLGDKKSCLKYSALIRSYGFDPADFYDRKHNTRDKNIAISYQAYKRAEEWINVQRGYALYITDANPTRIQEALAVYTLHITDTAAENLSAAIDSYILYFADATPISKFDLGLTRKVLYG